MSTAPERRARKGCYVVLGHDRHDHTDYLVGHYISLSRAKKAARNKARMANGIPTSFSDVFFVYNAAGECRYRVTFDELPDHLRHPNARLDMPEALPPPRRFYDRLFIKILLGLLSLPLLWQAKGFYDDMALSGQDKAEYQQMRKRFAQDRPGEDCGDMNWERYELYKDMYERELQSPTLPRARTEYLQDKLRFYEDTAHRGADVVGLLADFARAELAHAQPGEIVAPDAIYAANRNQYLVVMKAELPLREELGRYVIDWRSPKMPVVTEWDYRQLKRALALCEQIRGGDRLPTFGYLLDGGSGKEVPLDGYEPDAFAKMIAAALARQDVQKANTLYQARIIYQVMNWYVYFDAVQASITHYHRFLGEQGMDKLAQAGALESRLLKLNPYEYSQEYKDYRDRTLHFLMAAMARQPVATGSG